MTGRRPRRRPQGAAYRALQDLSLPEGWTEVGATLDPAEYPVRVGVDVTDEGIALAYVTPDGQVFTDRVPSPLLDVRNAAERISERQPRMVVTSRMLREADPLVLDQIRQRIDDQIMVHFHRPGTGWQVEPGPGDQGHAEFVAGMLGLPVVAQVTSVTCPRCGMISHHPADVETGYCGNCHLVTSGPLAGGPAESTWNNPDVQVPVCPDHGSEMAYRPACCWFQCREEVQGVRCRYVLTNEDRRRLGGQARPKLIPDWSVDEFTGAMTEREHRQIRQQIGLDVEPVMDYEPDWAEDGFDSDAESLDSGDGHWANLEHP